VRNFLPSISLVKLNNLLLLKSFFFGIQSDLGDLRQQAIFRCLLYNCKNHRPSINKEYDMLKRRFLIALAIAPIAYSTSVFSLELINEASTPEQAPPIFTSIQNASASPIAVTLSNGESFELQESSGKLLPCAAVSGVTLFINAQSGAAELSAPLTCGHVYTVKDDAQ
jgi:hypothetical protein